MSGLPIDPADVILLAMLVATAVAISRSHNLLATAMLTGIFSLLGACWMTFLDAPDVAFTEAAVGAGISTVLILATLCVVPVEEKQHKREPMALLAVVVTGAALIWATVDMPHYGDANAPGHTSEITRAYLYSATPPEEHGEDGHGGGGHAGHAGHAEDPLDAYAVGIPNTVTTVLASFRGYDTMGETAVIFTAGYGVVMILRGARRRRFRPSEDGDEG